MHTDIIFAVKLASIFHIQHYVIIYICKCIIAVYHICVKYYYIPHRDYDQSFSARILYWLLCSTVNSGKDMECPSRKLNFFLFFFFIDSLYSFISIHFKVNNLLPDQKNFSQKGLIQLCEKRLRPIRHTQFSKFVYEALKKLEF